MAACPVRKDLVPKAELCVGMKILGHTHTLSTLLMHKYCCSLCQRQSRALNQGTVVTPYVTCEVVCFVGCPRTLCRK